MSAYRLTHLSDAIVRRDLISYSSRDRKLTAILLAHIAEFDARKLFVPDGYPSMFMYSVGELGLSDHDAFLRIRVARTARKFPIIFEYLEDGRLNITSVMLLRPYLGRASAEELLAAAIGKRKSEIQILLAERFPRADV